MPSETNIAAQAIKRRKKRKRRKRKKGRNRRKRREDYCVCNLLKKNCEFGGYSSPSIADVFRQNLNLTEEGPPPQRTPSPRCTSGISVSINQGVFLDKICSCGAVCLWASGSQWSALGPDMFQPEGTPRVKPAPTFRHQKRARRAAGGSGSGQMSKHVNE